MARTQFTFTFRNAEPGAAVTFSADVFSSPTDQVADGPTLALDTTRSVAVWSDATELTATWVDGSGASVEAEASVDIPVVVETGGVPGAAAATGSSTPDSRISVYANGGQSIVQSTQTTITGLTLDTLVGNDFEVDEGGAFIHVLTAPCTLLVQATAVFHSAHSSTDSFMDIYAGDATGVVTGAGTIFQADNGANGVQFPINSEQPGQAIVWLHFDEPGSISLKGCPIGGNAAETTNFAGIDILRLA